MLTRNQGFWRDLLPNTAVHLLNLGTLMSDEFHNFMVALNRANIPASITTVEALAAWCCALLANTHFQTEVQEGPNVIQKVAVAQIFPVQVNSAYQHRFVGRVSLPVQDAWLGGGKIWERVNTLSSASVPGDFNT